MSRQRVLAFHLVSGQDRSGKLAPTAGATGQPFYTLRAMSALRLLRTWSDTGPEWHRWRMTGSGKALVPN